MPKRPVPLDRLARQWSVSGLTVVDAALRAQAYGRNDVVEVTTSPWWGLARNTAKDPMIWFFAATSALYASVGQVVEAITLLVAIGPLVLMDVFLHRRTQASTEGLKSRLAERARVMRDGLLIDIPATEVVPGDLAVVASGETFPAGGVIIDGADLQADESSLTGESYAVRKRLRAEPPRTGGGADRMGQVAHGRAMAFAVLTLSSAAITAVLSGMRTLASRVVVIVTVVLSMVLIQIRPLSALLSLTPLHPDDWLLAVSAAAIAAAVLAGFNGMQGRRFASSANPPSPVTGTSSEAHSAS